MPSSPPQKRSLSLRQRYRRLSLWNKVAFWGSIASILALLITFLAPSWTPSAPSADQIAAAVFLRLSQQGQTTRSRDAGVPPLDFPVAFREAAKQFHTTPEQAERIVREWVAENQNSPDLSKRAEAEFLARHYTKAAELWDQAVEAKLPRVDQLTKDRASLVSAMVQDLSGAGAAFYANGQLSEALARLEKALSYVPRPESAWTWARLENGIGVCHAELGTQMPGVPARRHLDAAIKAFRHALGVYTRNEFPQDWALVQSNLGSALRDQAKRSEGPEAARLLSEALTAFREALKVRTRERFPQGWAATQCNLGIALRVQAARAEQPEPLRLSGEAVTACQEALKVYTREQFPQDWAMTQNDLGNALADHAHRSEGPEAARLLGEATKAFRAALEVFDERGFSRDHAGILSNLRQAEAVLQTLKP